MHRRQQSGFTLLEVMVALAVLAIAGMSLMGMVGETLRNSMYLADKRPAFWVAENAIVDITLSRRWPPLLWKEEQVTLGDRTWYVRSRSVETVTDDLRAVEVEVRDIDDSSRPALASLQSHLLKP